MSVIVTKIDSGGFKDNSGYGSWCEFLEICNKDGFILQH